MPALPVSTDFTDPNITEAQFKTAMTNLRNFLSGLLGTDGNISTALAALQTPFATGLSYKHASYAATTGDRGKVLGLPGGLTLTLPAAATAGSGFCLSVHAFGDGVIIDGNASEKIDGQTTITLRAGESCVLVCDGGEWWTVGRNTPPSSAYPISISQGGTAATSVSSARDNLSVVGRDHGQGNVGSLCFARSTSVISAGSTISGSNLKASGINFSSNYAAGSLSEGVTLSGTWRALGTLVNPGGSGFNGSTLFQRIS